MKNKPILICFGTRPEWIKVKPILNVLPVDDYKLLFTGQHLDLLKDIQVDYKININSSDNRLDAIVIDCLQQFPNDSFGGVLVQGDTASALGCALAAFHRKISLYYLEAGLRSYDIEHPYPEEGYRQIISRMASINFAPTEISANNLSSEKVFGKIHVVGNTVLDNLVSYTNQTYGNKILITLHRRENHEIMHEWFQAIEELASKYNQYQFILPMHPSPDVQKHRHLLQKVNVTEPLTHAELLDILIDCKLVITDSGGLQEEATFFNKKTIVCRKTTERPEGIYTGHLHLCKSPHQLAELFFDIEHDFYINVPCPYGDGYAAQKIKDILYDKKF